jgi:hypothetical protein
VKWLDRLLGLDISLNFDGLAEELANADETPPPPIATSFRQTGTLPHSTRFSGVVCRFHKKQWLFTGDQFYRNWEDSPRKWAARERYAGQGINCGHFFGCSVKGSRAEGAAYKMDAAQHSLLELELDLESALDLTCEENIDWILGQVFENPEVLGNAYFPKLIELIDHQHGGDQVNEFIGHVAVREGFDSLLFFGARALRKYESAWTMNPEDPLIYMTEQIVFPDMRAKPDLQNLVVFSGSGLTRRIARYRIDGGDWQPNPFHGVSAQDLDKLLEYPAESKPAPRFHIGSKIRLVPTDRGETVWFNNESGDR